MIKGIIFDYNRTLYDVEGEKLIDRVPELLRELSGKYKLCLISRTSMHIHRLNILKENGLDKLFDKILIVNAEKEEKKKKHFLECMESMGLDSGSILVVGDKVRSEIFIGKSLGMKTVWLKNGKYANLEPIKGKEPDYIITNLEELREILD